MKPLRIVLPTEFQIGTVNAYLFTKPEPVLVDTGVKSEAGWQALAAALAERDLAVADLARVVITHPHVDHCGQAGTITAHSDADIWIWEEGAEWLLNFRARWHERLAYYRHEFLPRAGMSEQMQQMALDYMAAMPATVAPVPAERVCTFTLDNTLLLGGHEWQVHHMPGHASMQTCFYQPQTRQFLSADMLLHKAPTPIVERPSSGARVPALPQFLRSLDVVEALEIDTVYPGHGEPFGDHRAVIRRQRARIRRQQGPETEIGIAEGGDDIPVEGFQLPQGVVHRIRHGLLQGRAMEYPEQLAQY